MLRVITRNFQFQEYFRFHEIFRFHEFFQTHPDLPGRTSQDVSKTRIRALQPRFYHQTQE